MCQHDYQRRSAFGFGFGAGLGLLAAKAALFITPIALIVLIQSCN